jgi:hypothetical protein
MPRLPQVTQASEPASWTGSCGARLQRAASTFVSMSGACVRPREHRHECRRGTLQAYATYRPGATNDQ